MRIADIGVSDHGPEDEQPERRRQAARDQQSAGRRRGQRRDHSDRLCRAMVVAVMRMMVMMIVGRVGIVPGGRSVSGQGAVSSLVEAKLYSISMAASNARPRACHSG